MGLAIHTRGYYLLAHGHSEGEADLDRATKTYERVLALGGTDSKVLNNIGYVDVDRAAHLAATDRDPKPAVADGIAYEQRALAANPNERFVFFNLAGMQLTAGGVRRRARRGSDGRCGRRATGDHVRPRTIQRS